MSLVNLYKIVPHIEVNDETKDSYIHRSCCSFNLFPILASREPPRPLHHVPHQQHCWMLCSQDTVHQPHIQLQKREPITQVHVENEDWFMVKHDKLGEMSIIGGSCPLCRQEQY